MDQELSSPAVAQPLSRRAMPKTDSMPYMEGLNQAQRSAVEHIDGPILVLAGAGTGKTRALTTRIAHILASRRARPSEILAVTFTNKAAREMRSRIGKLLGETVEGMAWLGTFHSVSVKMLRRHAELVGLKSNFTILDKDDQLRLLKQLIAAENLDEKRWPPRQLAALIDGWKNRAIRPEAVPGAESAAFDHRGSELYAHYQERLLALNACDFGDLVLHVVTILQKHGDVLEHFRQRFRYILVDEYQDTNTAQYMWLRLLAAGHQNICCVGDDDQSIYGWRGAEVGNILRFESDFPGARIVRLEQNYRSTPHILAAASGIISANKGRLGKELWTEASEGESVQLIGHWDGEEEARWIGEEIEALLVGRRRVHAGSPEEIALLVRATHQMRAFEDRFLAIGLPYRVIGGPRFYERMEIRDAIAYFRLVVSSSDDLAFERIINTPKRGLGNKAQATIQGLARDENLSLTESASRALQENRLSGRGATQLNKFLAHLDRWKALNRDQSFSHIELAELILDESGYTTMWQNETTPEANGRLENLKELIKALEGFDNLEGFLEHVSLIMENESDAGEPKISIMTLHAAKGLEYPVVFLPGWEDGLFPNQRALDETGVKGLEEERRLAYVGITRAEQLAIISFAANRRVFGQWQSQLPSRFIDELPENHIDVLTEPGLYGSKQAATSVDSSDLERQAAKADIYASPGWQRLQSRGGLRAASSQPKAQRTLSDVDVHPSWEIGTRVFSEKFGYGQVLGADGDKLSVNFEKAGLKKIIARYVMAAEDVPL